MERGVASMMDTVFLIVIAMVAASMIFYSGQHYGSVVNEYLTQLMTDYYAKQVLRVLTSVSIERPGCGSPDYLLAYLKEKARQDVDKMLDGEAGQYVVDVVKEALGPMGDAYDYAFILDFGKKYRTVYAVGKRVVCNGGCKEKEFVCKFMDRDSFYEKLEGLRAPYAASTVFFFKIKDEYVPVQARLILWPAGDESGRIFNC